MSKAILTYAAMPIVVALSTPSLGNAGLMAQEHIRQPVVAAPVLQDHSTIAEVHIRQPALDDAMIVTILDNANTADIETGRLAAQRGHANEVRQFGAIQPHSAFGARVDLPLNEADAQRASFLSAAPLCIAI
jgi:predicted outer membrane protein